MRFGIFYEHQLPRPWEPGDERRLLTDALEQVELADRLGFDYLWEVEHHLAEVEVPSHYLAHGLVDT
jgi:alkanesulfonate monooxygenase SsuD/methylene tetrahydromethanopterin reductase-like flavin-dependent oxidoreductase (luciferase family)